MTIKFCVIAKEGACCLFLINFYSKEDTMTIVDDIRSFVDDGVLLNLVKAEGYCIVPHVKFVEYDAESGVLKLLLGGRNPECSSLHVRNVPNFLCCQNLLLSFCQHRFSMITKVIPVSTHDPDFEAIVRRCGFGLRIVTPATCSNTMPAALSFQFLANQYPDVDCLLKNENHRMLLPHSVGMNFSQEVTMRELLRMTGVEWIVDKHFKTYSTTGVLLDTKTKITAAMNDGTMPPGLDLCYTENLGTWVVFDTNEASFTYYILEELV